MYQEKEVARRAEILYHLLSTGQPRTDGAPNMREVSMMNFQPRNVTVVGMRIHDNLERWDTLIEKRCTLAFFNIFLS
jgi:hypothetical protein